MTLIHKLKIIIFSRFKKENQQQDWRKKRRETCLGCEYNTLNSGTLVGYRFFLATLSLLFSRITGNKDKDNLGECSICGCSVFYKSLESENDCAHKPSKWEKVDKNTIKLSVREERLKHKQFHI